MIPFFCIKLSRRRMFMFAVFVLLMITGCATNVPLRPQDIGERAWLRPLADGFDGFFTSEDGRLLLVNIQSMTGDRWSLQEGHLLLWKYTEQDLEPQPIMYRGQLDDDRIVLLPSEGNDTLVYTATKTEDSISGFLYMPVYLKNPQALKMPTEQGEIYLQFNAEEQTMRGFGGVNNFKGSYQRFGTIGFKSGPLMSTKMAGPGMDYEMLVLSCLDHADTVISLKNMLFFFQDKELLGSFSAK